jgi:hypothetical protein
MLETKMHILLSTSAFKFNLRRYSLGVLTVSDRASSGVYEDQSGPEVSRVINAYAAASGTVCGAHGQPVHTRHILLPSIHAVLTGFPLHFPVQLNCRPICFSLNHCIHPNSIP